MNRLYYCSFYGPPVSLLLYSIETFFILYIKTKRSKILSCVLQIGDTHTDILGEWKS